MAINLSSFFMNNNIQPQINGQPVNVVDNNAKPIPEKFTGNAVEILKNMLEGDTFNGNVLSVKDGNVLLQMGNTQFTARLNEGVKVTQGQNITFMVESFNNNNVVIKPLEMNQQQAVIINKALEAAGFAETPENVSVVKELLNLNMPVSSEVITGVIKDAVKFPDTDINTIANLHRLDMPVTMENIAQFTAYKTYEHSILNELSALSDGVGEMLTNIFSENGKEALVENMNMFESIISAFYEGENDISKEKTYVDSNQLKTFLSREQLSDFAGKIMSEFDELPQKNVYISNFAENVAKGEITTKEFLNQFSNLIKENPELKDFFGNIAKSESFNSIINQMINETMKLTPSDVGKENGIKEFYKRIKNALNKASNVISDKNEAAALNKNMENIKSNIDFMNDLNKNMTYFQMPVKFKDSDANGELYVFTNKKALAGNPENVSAMLHLDMDNLGAVDVFVKLASKNVSTNFILESEELLDFVYSNIDKLNARLEAMGYNTHFEMKVADEGNKFNFVEDFIEKDVTSVTSQFLFDIKA